ncbi:hypothetical protein D7X94_00750 [Acutalibacter sp. 1XD8-33]|uniref:acyltransferase domain-containing protein n=1 Tax=Acutalibacter sp. 1XD8-33 TaxID=2320081 RepID=UPI000EA2D486|nr:acyltransferase domain-containing protein [Acutalibacter sp. 1XD8-33]RKJ42040.1 hypothetical protein D7X94_00750 [Acutalibacter sp. 1XD8-33]
MNKEFLQLFLEKTGFPQEAKEAYAQAVEKLDGEAMDGAIEFFYENDFSIPLTQPLVDDMAENAGLSPYTVWGLLLVLAAESARQDYLENGISEEIFWDTFCDLRYKALECKENYGVFGTFVAFWYPIFYRCDIVKLGRLEYETIIYDGPPRTLSGHTIRPGDKVLNIHIPSSGEPFDRESRLDSYRQAYAFFRKLRKDGPLVCLCHSWLLYPEYRKALPKTSNILSFMDDFTILEMDDGGFDDAWRVFGPSAEGPAAELPERTSMQRAFKQYLLSGGKTGAALGLLLFDGERLLY